MIEIKFTGKLGDVMAEIRNLAKMCDLAQERITEVPEKKRNEPIRSMEEFRETYLPNQTEKSSEAADPLAQTKSGAGDCRFCGKFWQRVRKHEPHCELNPANGEAQTVRKPIHIPGELEEESGDLPPAMDFDEDVPETGLLGLPSLPCGVIRETQVDR